LTVPNVPSRSNDIKVFREAKDFLVEVETHGTAWNDWNEMMEEDKARF
jgi:hypothetical protein